jgi:LuxR family maltose regulon positive regulatory protein
LNLKYEFESDIGNYQAADENTQNAHQSIDLRLIERLSERELQVVSLMADGLSNAEIAHVLYIALATVKVHSRNLFSKLDVSSRTQAIRQAQILKLL